MEVRVVVGKWLGTILLDLGEMGIAYHAEIVMQDFWDVAVVVALSVLW